MREGPYEVIVLDERDKPLAEIFLNNQWMIQAIPGAAYHVQVNIYRDTNGKFPAKYLRLGLFVDGDDVQYWKRLDFSDEKKLPKDRAVPISSVFWGFKKNTNEIRSFVFAPPASTAHLGNQNSSSSSSSSAPENKDLGTIRLVVHDAIVTQGIFANNTGVHEVPTSDTKKVSEDKKFWKQASVVTTSGKRVTSEKEKFLPLERWENCSNIPIHSLTLQYHQEDVIRLLRNPALQLKRKRENELDDDVLRKEQRRDDQDDEEETTQLLNNKEVVEVVREREVPLLDLSSDNPTWGTIRLKK